MLATKTNKRMLSDCFSAALQNSRKCGRYVSIGSSFSRRKVKPIKINILVFVLIILASGCTKSGEDSISNEELLNEIEVSFSGRLPIQVDEFTTFEFVKLHDAAIEKGYTISDLVKEEINLSAFIEDMTALLITQSCQNKQSLKMFDRGISEWHTYLDNIGKHLSTIKISEKLCAKT